jgi:hypothetical protein
LGGITAACEEFKARRARAVAYSDCTSELDEVAKRHLVCDGEWALLFNDLVCAQD